MTRKEMLIDGGSPFATKAKENQTCQTAQNRVLRSPIICRGSFEDAMTHKDYNDVMRSFWKQRKRLQRADECNVPAWYVCLCDCTDFPYCRCGYTIAMDTLESIGEEVADPYCMEDAVANRIFERKIYRCLPQMDTIDRIVIRMYGTSRT